MIGLTQRTYYSSHGYATQNCTLRQPEHIWDLTTWLGNVMLGVPLSPLRVTTDIGCDENIIHKYTMSFHMERLVHFTTGRAEKTLAKGVQLYRYSYWHAVQLLTFPLHPFPPLKRCLIIGICKNSKQGKGYFGARLSKLHGFWENAHYIHVSQQPVFCSMSNRKYLSST